MGMYNVHSLFCIKGEGMEKLLVQDEKKKEKMDEIDGDSFRYFLLAGFKI